MEKKVIKSKIDWSKVGEKVDVISTGKSKLMPKDAEYNVGKQTAEILVKNGSAKLK